MTIHRLIREGRARLGLTETDFAAKLGVTRATVQQWENGKTAPNRKRQPAVAELLGVTLAELMGGTTNIDSGPELRGRVPLISEVQAGAFREFVDNYQPGDGGEDLIATSVPVKRHTFALRVSGDSMEPEFMAGMILIIEPDLEANPGDFVVAKNGGNETTFKQLVQDGGDWYLKPLNPRYPIKPLGMSEIVGVLRAVEKRYR